MAEKLHCKYHETHQEVCPQCRSAVAFGRLVEADKFERDAPLGRNGGIACDVRSGPCACGAWH